MNAGGYNTDKGLLPGRVLRPFGVQWSKKINTTGKEKEQIPCIQ
jgi:hypothetical protein